MAARGTDLAPDPATIFGVLPNGMRYAVRHNDQLPGRVAMRFIFDVGSMHEAEDQLGVAHLLEHMAFNGSKNVPEGEVMKMMQRLGSAPARPANNGARVQACPGRSASAACARQHAETFCKGEGYNYAPYANMETASGGVYLPDVLCSQRAA